MSEWYDADGNVVRRPPPNLNTPCGFCGHTLDRHKRRWPRSGYGRCKARWPYYKTADGKVITGPTIQSQCTCAQFEGEYE